VIGPKTLAALQRFQRHVALPVTGVLNALTRNAMRAIVVGTESSPSSLDSTPTIIGTSDFSITFGSGRDIDGDDQTLSYTSTIKTNTHTCVRVYYATDRKEARVRDGYIRYAAERSYEGAVNYGECTISIPKIHKVGNLESPSILKLEFHPDPKRHIVLEKIETMQEEVFFKSIAASVSRTPARDAFVFVHGYNVSFEDAARRTAQIAFDLNFIGAPIFYSWPSNGKVADYIKVGGNEVARRNS
jgi:hypothetical protein